MPQRKCRSMWKTKQVHTKYNKTDSVAVLTEKKTKKNKKKKKKEACIFCKSTMKTRKKNTDERRDHKYTPNNKNAKQ